MAREKNEGRMPDGEIAGIVARWQDEVDAELDKVIGYTDSGIGRRTPEMEQLIVQSWLWAYPTADVAMTNLGGIRAGISPGDLTLSDLVGVLPF